MKGFKYTAEFFIKEYGKDVYEICDNLGIYTDYHELGKNIKGYIIHIEDLSLVVLNNSLEEWQKELVLAHELGHFAFHKDETNNGNSAYIDNSRLEYEANYFAIQLLGNKKYLNDSMTPEVCEFLLKMSYSNKVGAIISSNIMEKKLILCGKPMTDEDVKLLEISINNTIEFANKLTKK